MIVCSCNVLTDRQVREAVASGAANSPVRVHGCLGCSAKCGRCIRTIRKIMDDALVSAGCPWAAPVVRGATALYSVGACHPELEKAMKGDSKVIDYLNQGLRSELTAVNQYWLHYRILENWGLLDLAKQWRKESIEEMRHADKFVERIIFLDGFPNMQVLDPLRIGQTVKEVLDCDLAAEVSARTLYQEAAKYCHSADDFVTRDLFEELMADEEHHIDFLETQLDLVDKLGVELYSQRHMGGLEE